MNFQNRVVTVLFASMISFNAFAGEQTLWTGERFSIDVSEPSLTVRLSYPNLNGLVECLDTVLSENGSIVIDPIKLAAAIRVDEGYFVETNPQEIVFPTVSASQVLSYQLLEHDVYVTRIRVSSRDGRPLDEVIREIAGESYGSEFIGFERTDRCGVKP